MIRVNTLGARAGAFELRDVSFTIDRGKWGIVLGPAGAGKTTLLETIAGVRRVSLGSVLLRGEDVTRVPAELRGVGMVYQHAYLFPHLRVAENIAYGAGDAAYAREIAARFGVDDMRDRSVTSLSGGERQIVALARALAPRPDVLLLDEPFAALDPRRRTRVRRELRALQRELGLTVLQVTHDFAEAGTLGDVVVLLENGRTVQVGAPEELFRRPATAAAAEFLGAENVLTGVASGREVGRSGGRDAEGPVMVSFETLGGMRLVGVGEFIDGATHVVIRGEDVVLARERPVASSARNVFSGVVLEVAREGALARVAVDVDGVTLVACVTAGAVEELGLAEGVAVVASVKATAVHLC
jgi:molybdopterin-binding protein